MTKESTVSVRLRFASLVALAMPGLAWAQTNTAPTADDLDFTSDPGAVFDITLSAPDPDPDNLSFIVTALPTSGDVTNGPDIITDDDLPFAVVGATLTYLGENDDTGQKTIKYIAFDGTDESAEATITILIQSAPRAIETVFFTKPNETLKFDLPAEDLDGGTLTYTLSTLPGHGRLKAGSATLTDTDLPFSTTKASMTYTPDTDYHGPDTFTFTASDGANESLPITTAIEVNTTPVPSDVQVSVPPNGSTTIELIATDADKDPVRFVVASLPAHGSLAAGNTTLSASSLPFDLGEDVTTLTYTVAPEYLGTDSFHFKAKDGVSESDRAVVAIAVNSPPTATDSNLAVDLTGSVTGTLKPTDSDGDALSGRLTSLPSHGAITASGAAVSDRANLFGVKTDGLEIAYEVESESATSDVIEWVATDGKAESSTARINITILDVTATDGDDSGNNDDDDEDVLSDVPDEPTTGSGCAAGAGAGIAAMIPMAPIFSRNRRWPGRIRRA